MRYEAQAPPPWLIYLLVWNSLAAKTLGYQVRSAVAKGLRLSPAPGKDAKDQAHKLIAFAGSFIKGNIIRCVGCRWV